MSWTCLLCENVNDLSEGYGDETTCGYCGNASGGIPVVGTRAESLMKAQGSSRSHHHHQDPYPPPSSAPFKIPPNTKTVGQLRKLGWHPKMYSVCVAMAARTFSAAAAHHVPLALAALTPAPPTLRCIRAGSGALDGQDD